MIHIAITGKMGSGKTTLAELINTEYLKGEGIISSFAAPIKDMYNNRELFADCMLPLEDSTGKVISTPLLEFEPFQKEMKEMDDELKSLPKGTKPRRHYQYIGQLMKVFYGKDIWTKKLFADFEHFVKIQKAINNKIKGLIIDDLRMTIEFEEIKNKKEDFIIIGLEVPTHDRLSIIDKNRLGDDTTFNHASETEVEDIIDSLKGYYTESYYEFESGRRIIINNPDKNLSKERREILELIIQSYELMR